MRHTTSTTKSLFIILIFCTFSYHSFCQNTPTWEIGIGGGIFTYQGDLTPNLFGSYKTATPVFTINATRLLDDRWAVRLNTSMGPLEGNDVKYAVEQPYRAYRKFRFKSQVTEVSILGKWNGVSNLYNSIVPYVMGGFGFSRVNVNRNLIQTDFNYFVGENLAGRIAIDQGEKIPKIIPVVPVGLGLGFHVSDAVSLNVEYLHSILFTDYLDGFSVAANTSKNDRYNALHFSLHLTLGTNNLFYNYQNRCPKF